MRLSSLAGRLAILCVVGGVGLTGVAMAQSGDSPPSDDAHRNPEMQADTHEGQNQGASAQYEMSSEERRSGDDVDDGDPGNAASRAELMEGTLQHERSSDSTASAP
ncbi:hypothetical protein [Salinicola acroporae]|uniref:Uncharacterized protein n=1 Tax=Salinicola acroporae TaxID=1541440 RepID=A0ABT6I8B2_9GAMM|nr:hypothetical protein [Salinicola acroporae]MDH4573758.1 hypothetical protein [Salinicola acroporae]